MAAVACVARLQRVAPSLLPFRAVAVGDDTNDHPSSSIEKKKKTQAKRTSAYRQTTSPPPRPPSMPRSDARFRDAASKLSSSVKTSAAVEVTAAAVTEASVEVTVKAEEEARTFLLLSLLLLLQVSGKVAASVDNDESPDPPPTRTKECVGLVLDLVRRNRLHRFSVEE